MYIHHLQGSEYLLMFDRRTIFSSFVFCLDVKHAKKLACHSLTKSLLVTVSEIKILHTGGGTVQVLSDQCQPVPSAGKETQQPAPR